MPGGYDDSLDGELRREHEDMLERLEHEQARRDREQDFAPADDSLPYGHRRLGL